MRVKLDLTRAVEENIIVAQVPQAFFQPVHVLLQLFQSVEDATIGT